MDRHLTQKLLAEIRADAERIGRTVRLMEVCGTHTMAISRAGLPSLLPPNVALLSGPGCPVCVTPTGFVDAAIALARKENVTVATFGDMVRVPGSDTSLEHERAAGADVRVLFPMVTTAVELVTATAMLAEAAADLGVAAPPSGPMIDAPIVEGAIAAAVVASAGSTLDQVAGAGEEARNARKL